MSYKPSTPVIEELQGVMLAKSLKDAGFAVVAHDPMASGPAKTVLGDAARFFTTARETIAQADAVVIITPWPNTPRFRLTGSTMAARGSSSTAGGSSVLRRLPTVARSCAWGTRKRLRPRPSRWPRNERSARRSPRPRMNFISPYRHEFLRLAACVPRIGVGDPAFNVAQTLDLVRAGDAQKIALMIFPELGISAYAIHDLLLQDALLDRVETALLDITEASCKLFPAVVVGAPLRLRGQLFNCAVLIYRGTIFGIVPKTYLPNYREFYEVRQCTSGAGIATRPLTSPAAPSRSASTFCSVARLRAIHSPCRNLRGRLGAAAAFDGGRARGRGDLLNLSASNITIGKADTRRLLCASQSARCIAAYAYLSAVRANHY